MTNTRFSGADIKPKLDNKRLNNQFNSIIALMKDGNWRTLSQIAYITGHHESSISAQLRNARKKRFGEYQVNKRRTGKPEKRNFLWKNLYRHLKQI